MEGEIQKVCIEYLDKHPKFWGWRNNTGRRGGVNFGYTGSSDWLGLYYTGKMVCIEFKQPDKDRTPKQQEFSDNITRMGGLSIVAYSLEDMIAKLEVLHTGKE